MVGMVFAAIEIKTLKVVGLPGKQFPDLAKMKERRRSDGSVDTNGLWSFCFSGRSFVLVESAKMILEFSKVEGEVIRNL